MVLSQEDLLMTVILIRLFLRVSFRGKPNYSNTEKRSVSYYLNAGYAYDNRYLLDANFRSDGSSSVFGLSQQFTTTWAIGLGWNVHNEAFLKDRIGLTI